MNSFYDITCIIINLGLKNVASTYMKTNIPFCPVIYILYVQFCCYLKIRHL